MTDFQRGILRTVHVLEQSQAKLLDSLWSTCRRGDKVRCLDDRLGSHFLRRGEVYDVDQMQRDGEGNWLVFLCGLARGFEVDRFERII